MMLKIFIFCWMVPPIAIKDLLTGGTFLDKMERLPISVLVQQRAERYLLYSAWFVEACYLRKEFIGGVDDSSESR
jgi:hypothetical protein